MFKDLIAHVAAGKTLDREQAERAFDIMMTGNATPAQMGGFLMALRVRGETVTEIAGAVRVMRAKMTRLTAPAGAMDTAGTGGDAAGTLNVSTAAAIVLAGAGVPMAKHGNRALSSKSGSADVLQALGVNIDAEFDLVQRGIDQIGLGFLMAPRHHGAMRNVAPARVELGTRTIFNLLGPLSNPAGVKRQLIGVFDPRWLEPMAEVLRDLGSEKVWVMHGADGLDELSTTGENTVIELSRGTIRRFALTPEDAGLPRGRLADLKGDDPKANAAALTALLEGQRGPYRDIVLLNAGAGLVIADKAADIRIGVAMAAKAIDSGAAKSVLQRLVTLTNSVKS
ncbi:MAG: anthranilate phosphoribosyltransferase [Alphaproteobacteria bacterium]|nr:anthranilate phosphoribosyltransferase [Alphaproteobacteria bacterium]